MNRCQLAISAVAPYKRVSWTRRILGPLLLVLHCASAQAADPIRIPPISAKAQAGVLRVTAPPEALLDGKPARLAPGARIRDRNNMLVVSGTLIGQDLPVRYTLDMLGLVHEVWVLTAAEIAAGKPPAAVLPPH